jgi:hypothetical protein
MAEAVRPDRIAKDVQQSVSTRSQATRIGFGDNGSETHLTYLTETGTA